MSVFSQKPISDRLFENEYFYIIEDAYPVNPGHLLIVSKREVKDFFELNAEEQQMLPVVIRHAREIIETRILSANESKKDNDSSNRYPDGFNIGMNCGQSAGQTIMQFHCHIIPRFSGDTPDPRGGIRHCIPGRGLY